MDTSFNVIDRTPRPIEFFRLRNVPLKLFFTWDNACNRLCVCVFCGNKTDFLILDQIIRLNRFFSVETRPLISHIFVAYFAN